MEVINIIIIYGTILFLFIGAYLYTRGYEKELFHSCSKKEHQLLFLYPFCLFLINKTKLSKLIANKEETREALRSLHIGSNKEELMRLYWCKKCSLMIFVFFLITMLSIFYEIQSRNQGELVNGNSIVRPVYGEGEKEIDLDVALKEKEGYTEKEIKLVIEERKYDTEEILKKLEEAKEYINKHILGKNESLENIRSPINLVKEIPNSSITVKWTLDSENLINSRGNLNNNELEEEGVLTDITASIKYYDTTEEYPITLRIKPKVLSREEMIVKKLKIAIENLSRETSTKEYQYLPKNIEDIQVYYGEQKKSNSKKIFLFGIFAAGIVYMMFDKELMNRLKRRETEVLIDYPEIINKFVLLLGAGMTMKSAWEKISLEYSNKRKEGGREKRYAYEEMLLTYHELNNGVIECNAYENFGKRMKALPYLRFSSLITQNLKKGSKGLLELLEHEAIDAFNDRKELAKRLGEEASTKLLGPMMLLLLIVLAIIVTPAFMGL